MRIVVVGAGVIGSIYGGRLARSGHDVTLLARGQRLADLQAHGLVLEGADSGQMLAHSAFVVPIGFALYRFDADPAALAADAGTMRLMVRATREAFDALDDVEIPANLRWLYPRMPTAFAVRYWRRVLASPRGELWFAAHTRAAPNEMHALAHELRAAVQRARRPTPNLDALVGAR